MQTSVAHTLGDLRAAVASLRRDGKTVGFVPTMGALHAGHGSLMELAAKECDHVVCSIFVNPTQFGPGEDFEKYPRTLESDLKLLKEKSVALCYAPSVDDMYPEKCVTEVSVGELGEWLCGASRPGHFTGVATVVAKLLLRVSPDVAVFGEKDYQQLAVIRRMVADLDIPVRIVGAPTMREEDGLAMSSRNAYLSASERPVAAQLFAELTRLAEEMPKQPDRIASLQGASRDRLLQAGFAAVEYITLCDAKTLHPLERLDVPARLLAAARLGATRLIDNVEVTPQP